MEEERPKQPEREPEMTVEQAELLVFSASYGLYRGDWSRDFTRTTFLFGDNAEILLNEKGIRLKRALEKLFPNLSLAEGAGVLYTDGPIGTLKNFPVPEGPDRNKLLDICERVYQKIRAGETSLISFKDTIIENKPVVDKPPFTDAHREQLAELIEDLRQKEKTKGLDKVVGILCRKFFEYLTDGKDVAYKEANPLTNEEKNKIRTAYEKAKEKMDRAGLHRKQDDETIEAQGVVNRNPEDIGAEVLFFVLDHLYEERAKRPPNRPIHPATSVSGGNDPEVKMVDHPEIKEILQDMSVDEADIILYRLTAKRFKEAGWDTITSLLPEKHVIRLDNQDGLKILAALLKKFPNTAHILRRKEDIVINAGSAVPIIENIHSADFLEVFRSLNDIYDRLNKRGDSPNPPLRCVVTLEELHNEKPGREVKLQAPSSQEFPAAIREIFLDVIKRESTHGREKALDLLYHFVAVMIGAKGLKPSEKKILEEAYDEASPKGIIESDLPIAKKLEEIAKAAHEFMKNGPPKLEVAINKIKIFRERAQSRKGGDGGKGTGGQPP